MDKKSNEQDILSLIYDLSRYSEVKSTECPDFQLQHRADGLFFGVEITEFYFSESNARLLKIPNYFNEILNQEGYRHKADMTELQLHDMTIISEDGTIREQTHGLFNILPSPTEYANMIAGVIDTKDRKFSEYDNDLDHINLIIQDTESRLALVPKELFHFVFYTQQLKEALFRSSFREIFLITTLDKERRVYIPLKMLLLLGELKQFEKVMRDYPWETLENGHSSAVATRQSGWDDTMALFSKYLRSKCNVVFVRNRTDKIEVIFGGSGVAIEQDHIGIYDLSDYPIPKDAEPVDATAATTFFSSEEFRSEEAEILENTAFEGRIAFDINGEQSD